MPPASTNRLIWTVRQVICDEMICLHNSALREMNDIYLVGRWYQLPKRARAHSSRVERAPRKKNALHNRTELYIANLATGCLPRPLCVNERTYSRSTLFVSWDFCWSIYGLLLFCLLNSGNYSIRQMSKRDTTVLSELIDKRQNISAQCRRVDQVATLGIVYM